MGSPGELQAMTHKSGKLPDRIQFFEIDYAINEIGTNGQRALLPYISFYESLKLGDGNSYKNIYEAIADYFEAGTFKHGSTFCPVAPRAPTQPPMTSLSLSNDYLGCIVLKLHDKLNINYDGGFAPFSVVGPTALDTIFSDATLVLDKGGKVAFYPPLSGGTVAAPLPPTHWGFFIFDGTEARKASPGGEYVLGFNMHVELVDPNTGGIIGLTIDPDVGHPGGKGGG